MQSVGQTDLFGSLSDEEKKYIAPDYVIVSHEDTLEKLSAEKNVLGLYLSGHPIKIYENEITRLTTCAIDALSKQMGKSVCIAGLLIAIKKIITKQGKRMAILTLEDRKGVVEVTLFSKLCDEVLPYLEKNQVYIVHGKVEEDSFNQNIRMLAESIELLDVKRAQLAKRLVIFVESEAHVEKLVADLPPIMQPFQGGHCPVQVFYQSNDAKVKIELGKNLSVHPKNALLAQLKQLCGEAFVKVGY